NGNEEPLLYGPAHVVWEDENFDSAKGCLENFDKHRGDYTEQELDIVKRSLSELEAIPIDRRCVVPDNYDGEQPELFPPPANMKMLRM
ncbi:hypothetical protein LCGC14_1892920, partial [marine sediment metagenome]